MKILPWVLAAALLPVALLAAPPKRPAPHAAAKPSTTRDWTQVASSTAEGGELLGNPQAKVKLVEYLSLTCPHCAAFEATAVPKLIDKYVKTGRVSYEARVALRDPFDLAASVLARCDGPKRFFQLAPVLFASQTDWLGKAQAWAQSGPDLSKMSEADAGRAMIKGAGLDELLAKNGQPVARSNACIANMDEQKMLAAKAQAIWAMPGFPGTPAFGLNGTLKTEIHDWAGLDAALTTALR